MKDRNLKANPVAESSKAQGGSVLVMTLVVMALLTAMGIALVTLANSDVEMNQTDALGKRAFYNAEAGLDTARQVLRAANIASADPYSFDDELAVYAADGILNLNVPLLQPVYSAGAVASFTGYGNDVPLLDTTPFGRGWYAAFVTNDPAEAGGVGDMNDTNDRLMITAIGTAPDRVLEVVQAIVERDPFPLPPSTITMLGPMANFDGGSSAAKEYKGDDCAGVTGHTGVPGLSVPVIGAIGATSEASVEVGVQKPDSYTSNGETGADTVEDVSGTIDPQLMDCDYLLDLADQVRSTADYICSDTASCDANLLTAATDTVTFCDGDLILGPGTRRGFLWVTGTLTMNGNSNFEGVIFVVGEGIYDGDGGGSGSTWGSTLVADLAGADNAYGTGDDCTGPVAGFDTAVYHVNGMGSHDTVYCSELITEAMNGFPLKIRDFRQR